MTISYLWRIYCLIQLISLSACLDGELLADEDYTLALEQKESSEGYVGNIDASILATKAPKTILKGATTVSKTTKGIQAASITTAPMLSQVLDPNTIHCKNVSNDLMNTDPDQCCLMPTVFPEEVLYNCQTQNKHRVDWFYDDPPDNECVVQCMFEAMQMLVDNKTIIKDRLVNETLRTRTSDRATWEPIVTLSVDECLKLERSHINATGPVGCNPYFYMTLHCVFVQLMKNCPGPQLIKTPKCNALSIFVQKCDVIPKHRVYLYN